MIELRKAVSHRVYTVYQLVKPLWTLSGDLGREDSCTNTRTHIYTHTHTGGKIVRYVCSFLFSFFFARWHRKMADCHTSLARVGPCWNFNTSPRRVEPFVTVPATRNSTVPGRGGNNGERSVDVEKRKSERLVKLVCFERNLLSCDGWSPVGDRTHGNRVVSSRLICI